VFVNSGSSENLVTLAALKELHGTGGEVIVPTITWVSDIAAVLHCGFEPLRVRAGVRGHRPAHARHG
jgi:CDP-6-deoxy-D-xylo-4-hexulose-3-dehydrase